jgi:hypothetical protein
MHCWGCPTQLGTAIVLYLCTLTASGAVESIMIGGLCASALVGLARVVEKGGL